MLTSEDIQRLSERFPFQDHEFLRGFVYITEEAITTRLDEVDPTWSFDIVSIAVRDSQCVCHARLTVGDVTRAGVGMQIIQSGGNSPNEAEKGAATDALKRCARLFGVGRYLLGAPKEQDFARWLNSAPRPAPQAEQPTPPKAANGDDPHKATWEKFGKLFNHRQHFDNFIAKHGAGLDSDQLAFKIIALVDMPARLAKHDVKLTEAQRAELGECEDYDALKIRVLQFYGCQTAEEIESAAKALTITVTDNIRNGVLLAF